MSSNIRFRLAGLVLVFCLGASACGSSPTDEESQPSESPQKTEEDNGAQAEGEQLHPEVLDAVFEQQDDGTWTVSVTLSSPYDTPERYADAWRVTSIGGTTTFGIRELAHDHANEQPFTRSESGIEIPSVEKTVLVQGRDLENGWGDPVQFDLP